MGKVLRFLSVACSRASASAKLPEVTVAAGFGKVDCLDKLLARALPLALRADLSSDAARDWMKAEEHGSNLRVKLELVLSSLGPRPGRVKREITREITRVI